MMGRNITVGFTPKSGTVKKAPAAEDDLDDIEIKLEGYSKSIQDVISQDAQKLVLEIREKIDSLKTEAKEKARKFAKKSGFFTKSYSLFHNNCLQYN